MSTLARAHGMEGNKMQTISSGKLAALLLAGLLAIVVLYFGVVSINRAGKTPISLSVFPNDTTITIDDEVTKTGTIYLDPGTYQLEAEKEGYDTYTKTLIVEEENQTVVIILTPESEEAFEYGRNNEEEYREVQAQGEIAAMERGETFNKRNPIAKHLPYKTFFYSIGYRMDQRDPSGNSIIIEIDAPEGYRQSAIYRIRQLGYDPTDFTINFREYENPFPL